MNCYYYDNNFDKAFDEALEKLEKQDKVKTFNEGRIEDFERLHAQAIQEA